MIVDFNIGREPSYEEMRLIEAVKHFVALGCCDEKVRKTLDGCVSANKTRKGK